MEEKKLEDFLPDKNTSYIKKFNNSNITSKINEEQVIKCIRTVVDPEIPVNLYDLGLIYEIKIKNFIKVGDINIDGYCSKSKLNIILKEIIVCDQEFM